MKVRAEPVEDPSKVLGPSPESEFTILVLPMVTYKIVAEQADKERLTAAQIFEKAVSQYIKTANEKQTALPPRPQADIVIRRRVK